MLERARALQPKLVMYRRHLHMHPELGMQEFATSQYVSDQLHGLGVEHQRGVARTGIVATLGNGNGPTIALRADMDALPIQEAADVAYKSRNPGVMHACGHDAHTAILLGVAELLARENLNGTLRLLFQPSEEAGTVEMSGGHAMVEEGALDGVERVWGLHVGSGEQAGLVSVGEGAITAAADRFTASIIGMGGHGAFPHRSLDPIWLTSNVLPAVYGIIPRRIDPTRMAVITVGSIHAGTVGNVIPPQVDFTGTIRSFEEDTRALLHKSLEEAFSIARTLGGEYTLDHPYGYPATVNAPEAARFIRSVATDLLGAPHVATALPVMAGEDFAYMARKAPAGFIGLGAAIGDKPRPHHHPDFDIDESVLSTGAAVLAETARRYLNGDQAAAGG
ncbi:MAG: amidohydrolase [Thermoflexales bacterium]|nr:amidohydrolase [Thermoflexales bacterium]